jgi:hypothetical protein
MNFEPMGGFPPFVRKTDTTTEEKPLGLRGFSTTNIVNISNILEKKKTNTFLALSSDEESGVDESLIDDMLYEKKDDSDDIVFDPS